MIIYVNFGKLNIFIEYIKSLLILEKDTYIIWKPGDDIIINDDHNIVMFMQVIPNMCNEIKFINKKKIAIVLCNTEQLTDNCLPFIYNFESFYKHIIENNINVTFNISDYSNQNIKILQKHIDYIELFHIPYQYNKVEIDFLKSLYIGDKKICTCGCQTERRISIRYNLFYNHYIKVNVVNGFYDERDKILMKHKILLNISAKDTFTIYEHIRCDRLLFAGMIVISEHKEGESELDIHDLVIWCNKEEFPEKIKKVLDGQYLNNDELINKIANSRRNIYMEFRSRFDDTA